MCTCCPDHICKKGNCLCVNCMKKNVQKNELKKGILINRQGYCSAYNKDKNAFFCNHSINQNLKMRRELN